MLFTQSETERKLKSQTHFKQLWRTTLKEWKLIWSQYKVWTRQKRQLWQEEEDTDSFEPLKQNWTHWAKQNVATACPAVTSYHKSGIRVGASSHLTAVVYLNEMIPYVWHQFLSIWKDWIFIGILCQWCCGGYFFNSLLYLLQQLFWNFHPYGETTVET